MTSQTQEPADMFARLGRHWGWVFTYGVLTLIAAIAVLVWPGETLLVLAVLLWAVRHALVTLLALAVFLGIFWVVNGVIEIFTALSHREMPNRGWVVAMAAARATTAPRPDVPAY
jgi:uncharacterized membrane protein HdeD (DUF308 family)